MTFLAVYGHVIVDTLVDVPRLPPPNTSIEMLDRRRTFGGTGGNIARAAARLGVPTALAAYVGDGFPDEYRQALEKDGIEISDLRVARGLPTPEAWVFSDPKGNQMAVVEQGPMRRAHQLPLLDGPARRAQLVHLGTGRPEVYLKIARLAKSLGKQVTLDPSQEIHYVYTRAAFRALLRHADFFFANEEESRRAVELLGVSHASELANYVPVLVLTRGRKGSEVRTRNRTIRIPALPARVVDVTGAGDAYRAGFYAGLFRGLDLARCAWAGAAAASAVVSAKGTQSRLPTWNQVAKVLRTRAPAGKPL